MLRFKFLWSWKLKELETSSLLQALWRGHTVSLGLEVTENPAWVNSTAAVTAHRHFCRYKMSLQKLSQIVTWAKRLLDGFLCFPVLADCCGQSVGAALNLESKEGNWGMIYSLLLAVKKKTTKKHPAKMIRQQTKEVVLPHAALSKSGTFCHGMLWRPK